jgi:DNA-binding MarR family transcriptional regulator
MFGLRASAQRWRERLANVREARTQGPVSQTEHAAMIAHAIYHREKAGRSTSLRQVHIIADINQPEAMRTINDLERDGMIVIEHNLFDALESQVALTEHMRTRLDTILRRDVA